jgi:drug/metabolite transporter (DMT)-like permease
VAATYGSNYACVKLLDEWIGEPSIAALMRFGVACAVMLPALGYCGAQDQRYLRWPFIRDGFAVGVWFAAGYCAQAIALETSPAGMQAFLLALSVLVCPLLEQLIDHKEQPRRVWYAAVLAATGVAALELDGITHGGGISQGDIIGLLQPIFFGAGFFQCEKAMARHQQGGKDLATPAALTAWQLVCVLLLTGVWTCNAGGGDGLERAVAQAQELVLDPVGHAAILGTVLWTGVGTTAGCSLIEAAALGELSSADATVVFATEPLWGAAFPFFLLGETMGPQCQLGGMLMVLACIISSTEGDVGISPAQLALSARSSLRGAQSTASSALSWAVETMGLAMGCSMGRGRSANPTRSRALARANMRMLGGMRKKR